MVALSLILITVGVSVWIFLPLGRGTGGAEGGGTGQTADLVARREQLLFALQDLDFELETGKLSREDHAALRAHLEADTVEVLQQLDGATGASAHPGADAD